MRRPYYCPTFLRNIVLTAANDLECWNSNCPFDYVSVYDMKGNDSRGLLSEDMVSYR